MNSLTLAYGLTKDALVHHTRTSALPPWWLTLTIAARVYWHATNRLAEPFTAVSLSDLDYLAAEGLAKIAPHLASQRTLDLYR